MIDVNTLTVQEAKAMICDEREKIDIANQNWQILRQIVAQKSQPVQVEEKTEAIQ